MRSVWTATAALLAAFALAPAAAGAQLSAGDIVVADPNAFGGNGGLIDVNPDTGQQTALSDDTISTQKLFRDPTGVAFDPDGSIIVADPNAFGGTGGLIRVDPTSGQQTPLSTNATSSRGPLRLAARCRLKRLRRWRGDRRRSKHRRADAGLEQHPVATGAVRQPVRHHC